MGIFDRKEKKPDFSNVQSGSSTAPSSAGAGSAAAPARAPEQSTERTYTVRSGDSLSRIAQREYGDANQWRRIFEANKDQIENPDLIYPGQKLRLPA